jgi:hypothetical protein
VLFLLVTSLVVPENSGLSSPVRDSWESTPLAEGNNDNDKYDEDSNIPDNNDEYTLRASYSQRRPLRV